VERDEEPGLVVPSNEEAAMKLLYLRADHVARTMARDPELAEALIQFANPVARRPALRPNRAPAAVTGYDTATATVDRRSAH
jgi:hypothetical protein